MTTWFCVLTLRDGTRYLTVDGTVETATAAEAYATVYGSPFWADNGFYPPLAVAHWSCQPNRP